MQPWMKALESHLEALAFVEEALGSDFGKPGIDKDVGNRRLRDGWRADKIMLRAAVPFSWAGDSIHATLEASPSVPLDTTISSWNLDSDAAWWYLDTCLPFKTVSVEKEDNGIRAICFAWIAAQEGATIDNHPATKNIFRISVYKDPSPLVGEEETRTRAQWIAPSQVFYWLEGETLGGMLTRTREGHRTTYGPGGDLATAPQVGEAVFMAATEGIARFILAGQAWLQQKILVTGGGHIERHRRKAFARSTKRAIDAIKIVRLRKIERDPTTSDGEFKGVLTVRFVVDGHWRNQAYGTKHGDRKLIWIHPYPKGPEDAPFKQPTHRIYRVDR